MMKLKHIVMWGYGMLVTTMAWGQGARLDHITQVVHDLDKQVSVFEKHGFTVKQGRLHANGLSNAFVQFLDGSEIELMAIQNQPTDDLAKNYLKLLQTHGEVATTVALHVTNIKSVHQLLLTAGIYGQLVKKRQWSYLVFPDHPGLAHVFLIEYAQDQSEAAELLTHTNQAQGITTVWLDGNDTFSRLLKILGGVPCEKPNNIISLAGVDFVLNDHADQSWLIKGVAIKGVEHAVFPDLVLIQQQIIRCERYNND